MLTGCISNYRADEKQEPAEAPVIDAPMEEETDHSAEALKIAPEIVEVGWSSYFNGLNGTAVVYDAAGRKYTIYNRDLAVVCVLKEQMV